MLRIITSNQFFFTDDRILLPNHSTSLCQILLCQISWRFLVLALLTKLARAPLSLVIYLSLVTTVHLSRSSALGQMGMAF
jgi:hypothetical protein